MKRWIGILWIALGIAAIGGMAARAHHEMAAATASIDTEIFWYTILPIFMPIMAGLCLFGWYAWKGEYDAKNPEHTP